MDAELRQSIRMYLAGLASSADNFRTADEQPVVDSKVLDAYEDSFVRLIQQEIAKARADAQLVFAATLRAAGGEVTLSKKELMSSNDYRVTRYDNNLDGSVTFQVETLKEHKDSL